MYNIVQGITFPVLINPSIYQRPVSTGRCTFIPFNLLKFSAGVAFSRNNSLTLQ